MNLKPLGSYLLLFVLVGVGPFWGRSNSIQTLPQNAESHQRRQQNVIDGREHPEMIQDRDAFRLFFLAVTSQPDAEVQRAILGPAQFSHEEFEVAQVVLVGFKTKYDEVVTDFNSAALVGEQAPDYAAFTNKLDALVLTTKDKLEVSVSANAFGRLYGHVQQEKRQMRVSR